MELFKYVTLRECECQERKKISEKVFSGPMKQRGSQFNKKSKDWRNKTREAMTEESHEVSYPSGMKVRKTKRYRDDAPFQSTSSRTKTNSVKRKLVKPPES